MHFKTQKFRACGGLHSQQCSISTQHTQAIFKFAGSIHTFYTYTKRSLQTVVGARWDLINLIYGRLSRSLHMHKIIFPNRIRDEAMVLLWLNVADCFIIFIKNIFQIFFQHFWDFSKNQNFQKVLKTSKMKENRAEGAKFFLGYFGDFEEIWRFFNQLPPPPCHAHICNKGGG